jgi:hypothetical protein
VKVQLSAPAVSAALMFAHAFWGAGYAFGPPRLTSSGSLRVAVEWLPGPVWGWLFLAGFALTAAASSLNRVGSAVAHVLAAAPLVAFVVALAVAQVLGYAEGWGGVLAFVVAAVFHAVLVQARFAPRAGRV